MSIFFDSASLLNRSRQLQQSAKEEVKMLAESYEVVYEQDQLQELIDELIAEGFTEDEIYDYLEEKMSDAEKRSLPARSRRRLGVTGPGESKKGKPLTGSAREASIGAAQRYRQERRAGQPKTERQKEIAKRSISNFMSTVDRPTAPITKAPEQKKTPKQRGGFRSGALSGRKASPELVDLAKAVKISGGRQLTPQPETKKAPSERGAFRSGSRPKGVASYDLTDRANAARLAAGREFQIKAAKSGSIADLKKQYQPSVPAGGGVLNKLQNIAKTAQASTPKVRETRQERKARLAKNAPARKERLAAYRAAKNNREVSDLKISGSELKNRYYSAPADRTTKNREMIARGVKGGIRKYGEKIKNVGSRVTGKIKKFFGKEDVDLLFASYVILEHEGYSQDEVEIILEWIDSGLEQEETLECLNILEHAIDDILLCQYIVENYEIETEEEIDYVVEQFTDEEFEYIFEEFIDEEMDVDRRKKKNKLTSRYIK